MLVDESFLKELIPIEHSAEDGRLRLSQALGKLQNGIFLLRFIRLRVIRSLAARETALTDS